MPGRRAASAAIARGTSGTPRPVQRVRDAVGEQGVDAGPQREDLERRDAARGGVALVGGGDVAADLADDAREGPRPSIGA